MSDKRKMMGDVLVIPKRETASLQPVHRFLLTGDSFAEKRFRIVLQVFTCLKKDGVAFQLSVFAPRLLREKLRGIIKECDLGDCATLLMKPPASMERYKEVIEVTDMLGQSIVLRKSSKMINLTAGSLLTNLKGVFEVKNQ